MKTYAVVLAPGGVAEEFIGETGSLRRARNLAAEHEDGNKDNGGKPPDWYDSAAEPIEWNGRYAIYRRPNGAEEKT